MKNLENLIIELLKFGNETAFIEFKHNNDDPEMIGVNISALSNSATYLDKEHAYIVWGIDSNSLEIIGTNFDYHNNKIGNEVLENWLRRLLSDNINFKFEMLEINNKKITLLIIDKAIYNTVKFKNIDYIRVGSCTKKLKDVKGMESQLWNKINTSKYEKLVAKQDLQKNEALQLIDYTSYFDLVNILLPTELDSIIHYMIEEGVILKQDNGLYSITNLGALLFSKKLSDFTSISRKSIRVIQYKGKDRTETIREEIGKKGYATGFEDLINYIDGLLPKKEEISGALRKTTNVYPTIVLRELIANALIHQDLSISGVGPTIEIFDNRIEITNPGQPLVESNRFIDNPPKSRNEILASLMRRANICEERGSGWDKVALYCEINQLPAPKIDTYEDHTKISVYSHIPFSKLSKSEKVWACYMHACLKQVTSEQMTNTSLRKRFGVSASNKASISRLIAEAISHNFIKPLDPTTAPKHMSYIPYWA